MPNPVTHIIVPMLIVETYRRYFAKKKFSRWWVFLAGFFGGMPDFDLMYAWIMTGNWDIYYHRNVTHTLLIPIIATTIGLAIYLLYRKKQLRHPAWKHTYTFLLILSIGIATHVILDGFDGFTRWFYPLLFEINLPNLIIDKYRAALIDGILMFAWLLYDEEFFNDILRFFGLKKKQYKK